MMEITTSAASAKIFDNGFTSRVPQGIDNIKSSGDKKEQLKKVAEEFESIFTTQMLSIMDKTVDKEGGILGEESQYVDTFKSHVFQEMGKQMTASPHTSVGIAKAIYSQMEKYVR